MANTFSILQGRNLRQVITRLKFRSLSEITCVSNEPLFSSIGAIPLEDTISGTPLRNTVQYSLIADLVNELV